MAKKIERDWFGIIAYVVGIGAILFTVIMIIVMLFK